MSTISEYKSEIIKEIIEFNDGKGYLNTMQFAKFMGISRDSAAAMLFNVPYIPNGREKLFQAIDIADKLASIRKIA